MTAPVRGEPVHLDPPGPEPVGLGRFGEFGGRFVPETLVPALTSSSASSAPRGRPTSSAPSSPSCSRSYAGRPTPVTECHRLSERLGVRVLLKREDLTHTGSHKINNVLGQALLTRRMGKQRVIAETGAGQHGVATATAAALFGLDCLVFMGAVDVERQALNVFRMKLPRRRRRSRHESGSATLKDAINEALRDWVATVETHALLHRLGRRPAPVPVDGARVPARRRRRGARAVPGDPRRSRSRPRRRVRRRRLERDRDVRRLPRHRRAARRRRGRRARARVAASTARR